MLARSERCRSRDVDRGGDLLEQALRDDGRLGRFADRGQEHGELVAAEPRHRVAGADHGLQPVAQDREHLVTDAVAVLVVDLLELVEVDEDERRTAGRPSLRIEIACSSCSWKKARFARPVSGSKSAC